MKQRKITHTAGRFRVRWGDKEIALPATWALLLALMLIVGGVVLYSDWSCGPVSHSAHDMPKVKK